MNLISIDETDRPYEEGESPYPHTLEDDLYLLKMVKENNWELKPNSYLTKVEKELAKNKENIHG